jgi:hypothetical protein
MVATMHFFFTKKFMEFIDFQKNICRQTSKVLETEDVWLQFVKGWQPIMKIM